MTSATAGLTSAPEAEELRRRLAGELEDLIAANSSLPGHWYSDQAIFDLEMSHVFGVSWLYAGSMSRLAEPGDYFTTEIALMPVVVVRDNDGAINAFINVCRHRGHIVCSGEGNRSTLQCPYHAWTYGLDGALRGAPRSNREPGFDKTKFPLVRLKVDTWGPFIFVNRDLDAAPLADVLGDMPQAVAAHRFDVTAYGSRVREEWEVATNWKIALDNGGECYHCATTHPDFHRNYHTGSDEYAIELHDGWTYQGCSLRDESIVETRPDLAEGGAYNQFMLWPTFKLLIFGNWMGVHVDNPISPSRTVKRLESFFAHDADEGGIQEFHDYVRGVMEEDVSVVELTHRGAATGLVPPGPLFCNSGEEMLQFWQRRLQQAFSTE